MSIEDQRIEEVNVQLDNQIAVLRVILMSLLERGDLTDDDIGNQIVYLRQIIESRKLELSNLPESKVPKAIKAKVLEATELAIEAATRELGWLLTLPLEAS